MRSEDVPCRKCGKLENYTNRARHERTCGTQPVCRHCGKPPHKLPLAEHEVWCRAGPGLTCPCGKTFRLKTKYQSHKKC